MGVVGKAFADIGYATTPPWRSRRPSTAPPDDDASAQGYKNNQWEDNSRLSIGLISDQATTIIAIRAVLADSRGQWR